MRCMHAHAIPIASLQCNQHAVFTLSSLKSYIMAIYGLQQEQYTAISFFLP